MRFNLKFNLKNVFNGFSLGIFIALALWGAMDIFIFSKNIDKSNLLYSENIDSLYKVYAFPVPQELTFAGEKIPVENFDVREAMDYEILKTTYWHSEMFLYLKRAYRYFPIIEPILKEHNIPDDFKYLAIAESGLRNVVSPAGAKGWWQFMKKTGEQYGLEINSQVDERYNLEKSTIAACKYLNDVYKRYNNWTMVAASYNLGIGNLNRQIKAQGQDVYWNLLLNTETGRYVYRITAIKLILENPQNYGFTFRKKDLYPTIPVKEIEIDSSVTNFANFAQEYKLTYKMFKYFNPWLRKTSLVNTKKKKYKILIPEKNFRTKDYFKHDKSANTITNTIFFEK